MHSTCKHAAAASAPSATRSATTAHWRSARQPAVRGARNREREPAATSKARKATADRDQLAAFNAQAMMLREQGQLGEAIALLQHGLPLVRQAFGDFDAETLSVMSNLGALLIEAKRPADAEPHCIEVVQRRMGALGDRDPSTIRSRVNLASLYHAQRKLREAAEQWREVRLPA